jgi:hypothetical protein
VILRLGIRFVLKGQTPLVRNGVAMMFYLEDKHRLFLVGLWLLGLLLLLGFYLFNSSTYEMATYRLNDGSVVRCKAARFDCGVSLWDCEDGQDRDCMTNVTELP